MKTSTHNSKPGMTKNMRGKESGVMLLEVMIALSLLIIIAVGLMGMSLTAIATTENQGHLAARTAEYAQDKMEQLMALSYSDTASDTSVFPAATTGGTGLTVGGSSTVSSTVTGYLDYLDINGNPLTFTGTTAPSGWYYIRVWKVSTPAGTSNLKQITVTVQTRSDVGPTGALPSSTVVCLKSSPF
jgi:Tfp pilus assembly protein PilV